MLLGRASDFYAEVLGLTPCGSHPGGPVFTTTAGSTFHPCETAYAGQAGRASEHDDLPGVALDGDVAELPGEGQATWLKAAKAPSGASTTRRPAETPVTGSRRGFAGPARRRGR